MRRSLRVVALAVAGFVGLQLLFFALLVGAEAVPDRAIANQLVLDVRHGTFGPPGVPDRMGGTADTFTECVVAVTGVGGGETSSLRRAGVMPRLPSCPTGATGLQRVAEGLPSGQDGYYFRYWAGYAPLTRPLLAAYGMDGVRVVSGALLLGALVLAGSVVGRSTTRLAALGLFAPLVLSTNLASTPSTSSSQALAIATYLSGAALVAWAARRSVGAGLVAVALAAALFCYVDLLTTPSIGWALSSAVLAGTTWTRTRALRPALLGVLGAGLVWPVSFALTWVSRWVLAVPFVGYDNVVNEVRQVISFRTQGTYKGVGTQLGAASRTNWHYWLDHIPTAHAVLWTGVLVVAVGALLSLRRGVRGLLGTGIVALPALCVPFWYEVLRNHSQIHAFFVYRCVPAALGVLLFASLLGAGVALQRGGGRDPGRLSPGSPRGRDVAGADPSSTEPVPA
ncbi:hypothetical protein ACFUC1_05740 [Pedococcus sp. NPDC057267]|uniref:hypothetical protein n=1 Tax=Pedococcus sp. NPDC057267 TaxID=3346077 RepID=UPI003626E82A